MDNSQMPNKIGHNSDGTNGRLQSFIRRIEGLEAERADLQRDIREVYAEATADGYDRKIMRIILRDRKLTAAEREARDDLIDAYKHALGMLSDTPLGQSALRKAGLGATLRPDEALIIGNTVIAGSQAE